MTEIWQATIETWPFQTGNGRDADQAAAGERIVTYHITADGFEDAVDRTTLICRGIRANPAVWQVHITKLARAR